MGETVEVKQYTPEEQDALRTEVRRVMEAESMTLTSIAVRAGIAYQTLQAWQAAKYTGRNENIAAKVEQWLRARESEIRVQSAQLTAPKFVMTPTAALLMTALEQAQFGPDIVQFTGGAGIGKTLACREYQRQHSNVWIVTGEPISPKPGTMMLALMAALEIKERCSGALISQVVQNRLRNTRGLIIMDEAQHLSTQSIDQLRTLHDLAGVGIALIGNDTVLRQLEVDGKRAKYAQLYRRIGYRKHQARSLRADIDMVLAEWAIEDEASRKLLELVARGPGALGIMTKVLQHAHRIARGSGKPLSAELIRGAWRNLAGSDAGDLEGGA